MPYRVSTEVEGWEIEALSRLDPDLCHHDFIDRMLPNMALGGGKFRPSGRTLEQRRRGGVMAGVLALEAKMGMEGALSVEDAVGDG